MRGYNLKNRRLIADYASVECQENFYEHYEKSKSVSSVYENKWVSRAKGKAAVLWSEENFSNLLFFLFGVYLAAKIRLEAPVASVA